MKILLIVLIILVTFNVNAEEAGWIGSFDGKSEHFVLMRGDETVPVTPLTVLLVGDEIKIKDKSSRIQLMLQGGNKLVEVTYKNSIFRITEDGKVPSPLGEFWKSVKKFLNYWYKSTPENAPPIEAGLNKGDEKQKPNIAWLSGRSRLIAGKRSLLLQWQNGKPPFKVKVTHKETVLWEGTVENSWIMTDSINFEAKKIYRVTVTDSENKT
ncbi:hypothetical protein QUF50_07030, partial [Thiotrichales bacterium HSG1]|nr:hypothetical protein [Thiotrichales bacterium HSG1]